MKGQAVPAGPLRRSEASRQEEVAFEDTLGEEWSRDLGVMEVPLGRRPLVIAIGVIVFLGILFAGRMVFLGVTRGEYYGWRAEANVQALTKRPAPRGIIYDRFGEPLAENRATFSALLHVREFIKYPALQEETIEAARTILGLTRNELLEKIEDARENEAIESLVLKDDLTQPELVSLSSRELPALGIQEVFLRTYREPSIFSSIVGYVGLPGYEEVREDPYLSDRQFLGRAGVEAFYDEVLKGTSGVTVYTRDARGEILHAEKKSDSHVGDSLTLTVDAGLQRYLTSRLQAGFLSLGRTSGVGLAMNPQNGEILALVNFPLYDSELLSSPGRNREKRAVLSSSAKPLFNRTVAGTYPPGSTIKPLVAVAALGEGVVRPSDTVFSPGYLDVPNPYDPENPTRFLDWRYQGEVDVYSGIAQSSNVYFYVVGGGTEERGGLGITRLHEWWSTFGLGRKTGIDLPGEREGFLPSPEWKEEERGDPWRLGDTYNVSIGQGDLLVTPVQLLNYISAIANGGTLFRPAVAIKDEDLPVGEKVIADLTRFTPEIKEVQRGMREAVRSPAGTARLLSDLGFSVAGKTGSAQTGSNEILNAFFVGYAPFENPQIALLILVEDAREGSLNAVPIARDVLDWYYWNRVVQ